MRESKTVETSSGTTWTKSVWAGGRLKAELDSDGTRYTYLWGPDRTPLSVFVERSEGATETYAYHTDAFGSVVAMTDSSGRIVARYAYDPYGRCTVLGATDPIARRNPLRYRAYYLDAETGMYYLPARYYDPATYRFLSPDPAPPSAADPLSLNAYAYCLGDPVDCTDPTGAVVDVDGDGRLDAEDSASENYIRTPASSRLKAARRAEMVAAEARAEAMRASAALRRRYAAMDAFFGRCRPEPAEPLTAEDASWEAGQQTLRVLGTLVFVAGCVAYLAAAPVSVTATLAAAGVAIGVAGVACAIMRYDGGDGDPRYSREQALTDGSCSAVSGMLSGVGLAGGGLGTAARVARFPLAARSAYSASEYVMGGR